MKAEISKNRRRDYINFYGFNEAAEFRANFSTAEKVSRKGLFDYSAAFPRQNLTMSSLNWIQLRKNWA